LLEALSCGMPCICSNVRCIDEIITHKENGFLCGTKAVEISEAIKTLYKDQGLREKLSNNARKYILKSNTIENIVTNEYKLCKELI